MYVLIVRVRFTLYAQLVSALRSPNFNFFLHRNRNEFDERHLLTAKHFETLTWNMVEYPELESYSVVVFYDYDGTAAANIYSILYKAFNTLKRKKVGKSCDHRGCCFCTRYP